MSRMYAFLAVGFAALLVARGCFVGPMLLKCSTICAQRLNEARLPKAVITFRAR